MTSASKRIGREITQTTQADQKVNPEMIVLARQSRGMTQRELASCLSVSQGFLSRVESGLRDLPHEMLSRISTELGYPVDFFFQTDRVYGFGITEVFHRRFQDIPGKTLDMIHAQTNIRSMHLRRMLRGVELGKVTITDMSIEEYGGSAEEIARRVRAMWGLPRGPVRDVVKTIEDARGIIIPFEFGTNRIDAIGRLMPDMPYPLFFVNMQSTGDRLRFTLCHELGHMVMHRNNPNPEMEREADKFAAEFLMPAREIRPYLTGLTLQRLMDLKSYWKVSMAAILKRAEDIGAITRNQAKTLWITMGKLGYRAREPVELDIPMERPKLLQEIVDVYRNDMRYSLSEFSSLVHLFESETRELYYERVEPCRLKVVK